MRRSCRKFFRVWRCCRRLLVFIENGEFNMKVVIEFVEDVEEVNQRLNV